MIVCVKNVYIHIKYFIGNKSDFLCIYTFFIMLAFSKNKLKNFVYIHLLWYNTSK